MEVTPVILQSSSYRGFSQSAIAAQGGKNLVSIDSYTWSVAGIQERWKAIAGRGEVSILLPFRTNTLGTQKEDRLKKGAVQGAHNYTHSQRSLSIKWPNCWSAARDCDGEIDGHGPAGVSH